jgi:hypothetical protein
MINLLPAGIAGLPSMYTLAENPTPGVGINPVGANDVWFDKLVG